MRQQAWTACSAMRPVRRGHQPLAPERGCHKIVRLTQQPPPMEEALTGRCAPWRKSRVLRPGPCRRSGRSMAWRRIAGASSNSRTIPLLSEKLTDVVGLYVAPPAHAVVLSVDEKSQIQALDRTQPGLPLKKGRGGDHAPRLQTQRNHHALRRAECLGRHGDRPEHGPAPPPGVHPLPQPGSSGPFRPARLSTSFWTTTPPTSTPRSRLDGRDIRVGRSTSRRPQAPG